MYIFDANTKNFKSFSMTYKCRKIRYLHKINFYKIKTILYLLLLYFPANSLLRSQCIVPTPGRNTMAFYFYANFSNDIFVALLAARFTAKISREERYGIREGKENSFAVKIMFAA